jgi:hypothetical protein
MSEKPMRVLGAWSAYPEKVCAREYGGDLGSIFHRPYMLGFTWPKIWTSLSSYVRIKLKERE